MERPIWWPDPEVPSLAFYTAANAAASSVLGDGEPSKRPIFEISNNRQGGTVQYKSCIVFVRSRFLCVAAGGTTSDVTSSWSF